MSTAPRPPRAVLWPVLALAVLGVSTAAPLFRCSSAHPVVLAFGRLALASLVCGAIAALRPRAQGCRLAAEETAASRSWWLTGLGGVALGVHFATWFASLRFTSIAVSVVLVNMQPVFASLIAHVFLGERLTRRQLVGLAIAIAGATAVSLGGETVVAPGARPVLGSALALTGALAGAIYYVIGRFLRQRRPSVWDYVTPVYGAAALALGAAVCVLRAPVSLSGTDLAVVAGLVVGPTLLGHTLLNWALRWLSASAVNVVALGEPVGAVVFGIILFGEWPSGLAIVGAGVVFAGILLVLSGGPGRLPRVQSQGAGREFARPASGRLEGTPRRGCPSHDEDEEIPGCDDSPLF